MVGFSETSVDEGVLLGGVKTMGTSGRGGTEIGGSGSNNRT